MPGYDGVPPSPLGHLVCGDYLPHLTTIRLFLDAVWPLLLGLVGVLVAVWWGWRMWRWCWWRRAARAAVWLQIVPPVTATPAATLALWQLLATLMPAPRRGTPSLYRLVWEVQAGPDGMRAGLWVPAGINPTAVLRVLHRAWPGVRADHTRPPAMTPRWPVVGVALRSTQPDWLPLVEHPDPVDTRWWATAPEADRIRAVFDGLAAAGRTGGALLQVHVARAPRHRLVVLRRATVNPHPALRGRGTARMMLYALEGVRTLLAAVLDLLTPGLSGGSGHRRPAGSDPVLAEQARAARAKHAGGPHLLLAIRATATGPTIAAARAAAADITSGYSLLSPHWRPHRLRRPATAARWRWIPPSRMQLATVAEAAAVAGLPAEPSAYGLPSAPSRRLPATRDVFTAPPASPHPTRPAPPTHRAPPPRDTTEEEPAGWSTP